MRVLITGITGFVGSHLTELLIREGGHALFGLSRHGKWTGELAHLEGQANLFAIDLADISNLQKLVREVQPQWVFHLAGYANTGTSFKEPAKCWQDNLQATMNLYDALAALPEKPRVLFASTGLIYGDPDRPGEGCDESTVLKPASPYAASKAAADIFSYQFSRTAGLPILRVRLFNQFGARQSPDYALARFAKQLALIEAGQQEPILKTGDLSSYRDLTDVRDMVQAMRLVIEKGEAGEAYNAGSGGAIQIRDIVQQLTELANIPVQVQEQIDPNRKADTAVSWADNSKLMVATRWRREFKLATSLLDLLDYWRGVVRRS
jgi:GDP-4-dehydro-6-deoxy-D-mannose reductase